MYNRLLIRKQKLNLVNIQNVSNKCIELKTKSEKEPEKRGAEFNTDNIPEVSMK